jgi:hypothetical protein
MRPAIRPMAFHPKHTARALGLHEIVRSVHVVGGIVLLFVGVLFAGISIGAGQEETTPGSRTAELGTGTSNAGFWLGAALATGGALLGGMGLRDARARFRLRLHGTRTPARVTGVRDSALEINGRRYEEIDFTYRDGGGREHHGSSGPLPPEETRGWRAGDEGYVAYDPARAFLVVWIGRDLVHAPRPGRKSG